MELGGIWRRTGTEHELCTRTSTDTELPDPHTEKQHLDEQGTQNSNSKKEDAYVSTGLPFLHAHMSTV